MLKKTLEKHDSLLQRILEIIPGFFIWILLLAPFWAGRTIPLIMVDFLIILAVYWLYRAAVTSIGAVIGYFKYQIETKKDWLYECEKLKEFKLPDPEDLPVGQLLPKHLLIYVQLYPKYEVLKTTLEGIRKQNYPLKLIYIAISFEERILNKIPESEKEYKTIRSKLLSDFPEFRERLMFFVHPDGLKGEVVGAAANRTWCARSAVAELEKRGEITSDFLATSPDEDIVFHPEYLAACTYKYLTVEKRRQKFYQTAIYTFNNNYWQVPILIRVLAASLTIPVLSSSVIERLKRETYSCYTVSLEVLRMVNYWDVGYGIDDTPFYWRPYFYFKGDWECEVFFTPLSADAVYNPNYIKNHREQYRQYVRWGWGVISFPIGFKGLLKHTEIPLWKRLDKMKHLFDVFVFWKVLAYLLTFGMPIVLLINKQYFYDLVEWYALPNTVSQIMGLAVIFIFPVTFIKIKLAPPKPKNWSNLRLILTHIIEMPLNIITLLTFSFLPFVEASTRMMFGQKSARAVTWSEKIRPTISQT
jgi:hypothetical protein